MRIAYVCTDPGVPVFGCKGGSIHVQEVLRCLVRRGLDVTLFPRRIGGEPPLGLESVKVRKLAKAPSGQTEERERFLLGANDELRDLLARGRGFDFVYERHALWSFAAMEYAQAGAIPAVLEVNAPLIEEQRSFRTLTLAEEAEAAAERAFSAAPAIVAVSAPLAAWLERRKGAAGKVHVVPNGVDAQRFSPDVSPTHKDGRIVTVGFVGSLRPWHGVEQLAEAFSVLRAEGLPVRLLVVGDGPVRERVEAACEACRRNVVMIGSVEAHRVPGLLTSMDIVVAPYPDLPGFYFSPLKLYEYMAAGRAVVASACGQIRQVLREGETGLLYEPGSVRALAGALRTLVVDPDLRRRLGLAARLAAVREHRWEKVVDRILHIALPARRAAV